MNNNKDFETSIKIEKYNIQTAFDMHKAMKNLGCTIEYYMQLLKSFTENVLEVNMMNMATDYENEQYKEMMFLAYNIKGASGYIGAGKLNYACHFMRKNYLLGKLDQMR